MAINEKRQGDCGYVVFYNGKRCEVYGATPYDAKLKAIAHWGVPERKQHMMSVVLAEKGDGAPVVHVADF